MPLGAAAGQTIDVTVRGADFEGTNALWFDHPGLRAFHRKGAQFTLAIAPGTPLGVYDVRAVSPLGVSNPRRFVVGDRPEAKETEPNNTLAQANPLTIGTYFNGELAATDVDCFRFEGRKDQRLFVEVWAQRLDSRLDAQLHVYGPDGAEMIETLGGFGPDPLLDLTLPKDGTYTIKLHDVIFAGSPDHVYRLMVHEGPHIDAILPTAAPPGVPTTFTLFGRNLGAAPCPELIQVDGHALERKDVTITLPESPDVNASGEDATSSVAAIRRGVLYHLETPSGRSNSVFISEASDPVIIEREPNDGGEAVQLVELPCDISGSFGRAGDLDVYRFRARKGEVCWIEAWAERIGSPADPTFMVQRVPDKGAPQDLAAGDDLPDRGAVNHFPTSTVDASLRWQSPEDGVYQVVLNDLYSSQRGDARLTYRLQIRREKPDFAVFVVPENVTAVEGLTLRAGGRAQTRAFAIRLDGYSRPIRIEPVDLPPGVTCEPTIIGANQTSAPLVFEAAESSPHHLTPIRLLGRGLSGDRKELLDQPKGSAVTLETTHEAQPGGMIWPPVAPQGIPIPGPARLTRGFVIAVREGAPFLLTAHPSHWDVALGASIELTVDVTRRKGFTEAVQINATNLPPNMGGGNATIAKDQSSTTLKLTVPANVPPGAYTSLLTGSGPFPFSKDPNAKQKPNVNVNEPSNPIILMIRK
jgi:hypothetical protein